MFRSKVSTGWVAAALSTGLMLGGGAMVVADEPAPPTIRACEDADTHVLKKVGPTDTCPLGAPVLEWNVVGPQGPAGPQGPKGEPGTKGDPGRSRRRTSAPAGWRRSSSGARRAATTRRPSGR